MCKPKPKREMRTSKRTLRMKPSVVDKLKVYGMLHDKTTLADIVEYICDINILDTTLKENRVE